MEGRVLKKTVFGSVVYKNALRFSEEFLTSIEGQTENNFDIILINDDLTDEDINKLNTNIEQHDLTSRVYIIDSQKKKSISHLRIMLLEEAKKRQCNLLVMGDYDDTFSKERVANTINTYNLHEECTFFYNELINDSGEILMKSLPEEINSANEISQYNFLGLSNTAINMNLIEQDFLCSLYECESNIFDWYLFCRLLLSGKKGKKIHNAYTVYRLYGENEVGIMDSDIDSIVREKKVKTKQYELLSKYSGVFGELLKKIEDVCIDENFYKSRYFREKQNNYWWEKIILEVD